MITASVYKGFKCIRNLRYSFHSFRCCLHLRIIRISSADAEQYHASQTDHTERDNRKAAIEAVIIPLPPET